MNNTYDCKVTYINTFCIDICNFVGHDIACDVYM